MSDSTDMFGAEPETGAQDAPPSAAEQEAAGQSALFGDPAPPVAPVAPVVREERAPAPAAAQPYRVLARKYRPQTFAQLIGQEAMVQTLGNAIKRGRLAHAFLMTGVRGVGKTSTARLIAKALNCIGPDGQGGPTIDPCGVCEPCIAIAEGRHIDVIEMDAASHTGVDDVREIIEAVRYSSVSARFKVYIIDEVHMLSRNAFNALLKTLEEPPPHVKFLFATTEVDKLPVTVLSRCQRFDLRRIHAEMLETHFAGICAAEGVSAEAEALAMIAAAAEGSVRDGLSILDQAISHADLAGGGDVTAAQVREMLGLADKTMQRRLFGAVLAGDGTTLLSEVAGQYALGIEPAAMLRAQMDLVNKVTIAQVSGAADARSAEEREAFGGWAKALSAGQLHRLWQLLLKGYEEVRGAPDPLVAAQMALLRVTHAVTLPDPGALVKRIEELAARPAAAPAMAGDGAPAEAPAAIAMDWAKLAEQVALPAAPGQLRAAQIMHDWVQVIALRPGVLHYQFAPGFSEDMGAAFRDALERATGQSWEVVRTTGDAAPSLREMAEARTAEETAAMIGDPLVQAALAAFPGAEIVDEGSAPEQLPKPRSKHA